MYKYRNFKSIELSLISEVKLSLSLLNTVTNKIPLDIMMSIVRYTSASINAISKIVVPKT